MNITELRDEFEASSSPVATLTGRIVGQILILAAITTLGVFAARWFPWVSVALGATALLATLFTLNEAISAVLLHMQTVHESYALYALASKVFELGLFIVTSFFLFRGHY